MFRLFLIQPLPYKRYRIAEEDDIVYAFLIDQISHCSQQTHLKSSHFHSFIHSSTIFFATHETLSTFNQFSTANDNFTFFYIFHVSPQSPQREATCSTVSSFSQHSTSTTRKLRRANFYEFPRIIVL